MRRSRQKGTKDIETATWYKQLGKITKPAATKAPKVLSNLDAENSVKTVHNHHLKPIFTLRDDDDKSEGLPPAANPRPVTPPQKNLTRKPQAPRADASNLERYCTKELLAHPTKVRC
jgi:hypothetical protein